MNCWYEITLNILNLFLGVDSVNQSYISDKVLPTFRQEWICNLGKGKFMQYTKHYSLK